VSRPEAGAGRNITAGRELLYRDLEVRLPRNGLQLIFSSGNPGVK
jgi:hypothetical protein